MSALGQKRTFAAQEVMSALPPRADMCGALADVRLGPKADIRARDIGKSMSAKRQKQVLTGELAQTRYIIAGIKSGSCSPMYASSSFTRYRKGLSPVASPDFLFPLMWPQMILSFRFISTNSTELGPPFSPRP